MGPPKLMPELPRFEFMTLPPAHTFVSKKLQQCNWAQACEGALDTAHFSFLHMSVGEDEDEQAMMKVMHQSEAAAAHHVRDVGVAGSNPATPTNT